MLKIQRSAAKGCVRITLSGRIEAQHLEELRALFESEHQSLVLDLREVLLVDAAAVRFLGQCELDGSRLENCPEYIREWIVGDRSEGGCG